MTAALADPPINGMAIDRILPVHESSRRLRRLMPESPRVHGVAVMSDIGRRRWWPIATAAQAVLDGNAATLRSRAQTALTTNATFLAIASPTAAQVATQTKALTRQVDALIRLAINALDSVSDA